MIPQTDAYDLHREFYDQKRAEGKELWFYNCQIPRGNYLNRLIDQPQWSQRLTGWSAFSRGATGYLHWAMNNWQYPLDDQDPKGDGFITWPDKDRTTVEVTTRYESLRDGIEDYEVLNLLSKQDPGLARGLAESLVQRNDKYTPGYLLYAADSSPRARRRGREADQPGPCAGDGSDRIGGQRGARGRR